MASLNEPQHATFLTFVNIHARIFLVDPISFHYQHVINLRDVRLTLSSNQYGIDVNSQKLKIIPSLFYIKHNYHTHDSCISEKSLTC